MVSYLRLEMWDADPSEAQAVSALVQHQAHRGSNLHVAIASLLLASMLKSLDNEPGRVSMLCTERKTPYMQPQAWENHLWQKPLFPGVGTATGFGL